MVTHQSTRLPQRAAARVHHVAKSPGVSGRSHPCGDSWFATSPSLSQPGEREVRRRHERRDVRGDERLEERRVGRDPGGVGGVVREVGRRRVDAAPLDREAVGGEPGGAHRGDVVGDVVERVGAAHVGAVAVGDLAGRGDPGRPIGVRVPLLDLEPRRRRPPQEARREGHGLRRRRRGSVSGFGRAPGRGMASDREHGAGHCGPGSRGSHSTNPNTRLDAAPPRR